MITEIVVDKVLKNASCWCIFFVFAIGAICFENELSKRLRHLVCILVSLKIRSFLETKHFDNQAAGKAENAFVVGGDGFVIAVAFRNDTVFTAVKLGL